jgi:membrane fusion protein (multidrug efflux system)
MMGNSMNEILNKLKELPGKVKELLKKGIEAAKNVDRAKIKEAIKNFDVKKLPQMLKQIDFRKIKDIRLNPAKLKKNYIWILLGILIAAFILSKTIGKIKQVFFAKEEAKGMVEFLETTPVKAYKVKRMDFKDTLPVMGRIEGCREIELKFDSKGNIESFNFEEGERILEGDIIASVDQKDALLKLKYASLELEKAKKLYEVGGVDKVAVDQKQLEYESAKRDLEKTNIYAFSDGYLGSKDKDVGSFVTSQDKVGTFVDFSEVCATFDVIEEDSPKMELGQNVEIFLDAYPGTSYKGTIDKISPMIEGRTRTQTVQADIDNEDSLLKPGMFARGIINTYEKKDALIIPASAFKKKENQYYVYVVHPEEKEEEEETKAAGGYEIEGETGTVEEREVEIEYLTHDVAEISKGLKEEELIIRELHQEYKDKDKVEITEIQETLF